jgi:plasmid maintenance system antidote protein VapI
MYMTVREKGVVLGEEMARDLGVAFDMNPQFFLNLDESWRREQP